MTSGPKCVVCGATLVAGNPVIRIRRHGLQPAPVWSHAGACAQQIDAKVPDATGLEHGRLAITVTYALGATP